ADAKTAMLTCGVSVPLASYFFFFFFSSRRRHTRFDCDWSSDVCSSDLARRRAARRQTCRRACRTRRSAEPRNSRRRSPTGTRARSEERRVGKEWRWRGSPERCKEKKKGENNSSRNTTSMFVRDDSEITN